MSIITVSREFGSGGRELGKRLADAFNYAYYDREILSALADKLSMDENYLARETERSVFDNIPLTFSRTLVHYPASFGNNSYILAQQHKVIKELAAKGNCVIVGRAADALLTEKAPITVFVYADMESKIKRCISRASEDEDLTTKEWEKKIKQVDKARAQNYALLSSSRWGDMHNYHLCINTSGKEIKELVSSVEQLIRARM